ncbi:hypothetical protein NSK_000834 [Nannochloropsis salina CCMP1776]|uniref:Uncharacterized protein n=1 Tax=Nannochloropsis salina CCMP1776 TaxID=1027361 RepID=A0A4D9D7B9_9STRA|nr:hypothetical protein NSK_000834 [Nannochloropsis salina CCMP1776]|eukprot:TFJ87482.1 hypothetical protein NSK_000834 [Nannochloropsis salina CCMP1776]
MPDRPELRSCGSVLSFASLASIASAVFIPKLAWIGQTKRVLFYDEEENTIEITSRFTFGFAWTRQSIITDVDQVVYRQDSYHCAACMPPSSHNASHSSPPSLLSRNVCLVLGVVAVLSVAQVGTGLAMVGTWAALKNALERFFSEAYVEVNNLKLSIQLGGYLALASGLAAAAATFLTFCMLVESKRREIVGTPRTVARKKGDVLLRHDREVGTYVAEPRGGVEMNAYPEFSSHRADRLREPGISWGASETSSPTSPVRRLPRGHGT